MISCPERTMSIVRPGVGDGVRDRLMMCRYNDKRGSKALLDGHKRHTRERREQAEA